MKFLGNALMRGIALQSRQWLVGGHRRRSGSIVLAVAPAPSRDGIRGLPFIRGLAVFVDGSSARMLTWSAAWEADEAGALEATTRDDPDAVRVERLAPAESRSVRKRLPILVAMLVFVALAPQLVAEALLRQLRGPPVLLSLSFQLWVAASTVALAILYGWLIARLVDIRRMFQNNAAVLRTVALHDRGVQPDEESLRHEPSFHPTSSACHMQATRVLRAFDGIQRSAQDYDNDGIPDLAGDFDGDGTPDLGGPSVAISSAGNSFGGMLAMVHGAVDPNVTATAPISGGGGLTDVATRSALVPDSVLEQIFTPLVVAVPAKTVAKIDDIAQTQCAPEERSVRFVVNDLTISREIEIACLPASQLDLGKTVVLENIRNGERRCARTSTDGRFRIPIPADIGDLLDVQVYDAPDAVVSYKGCEVLPDAPIGRRINTFEQAAVRIGLVGDDTKSCAAAIEDNQIAVEDDHGCQQFRDQFFPVGTRLSAPQEGLGLTRQSPEARRLFALVQAGIDSSDPINFAPYYGLRDAIGASGKPLPARAIIAWNTAGDPMVPSGTGYAFARAAGALPFLPPSFATTHPAWAEYATPQALYDALGGKTPNQVLIDTHSLEGIARLDRTRSGAACKVNYTPSAVCLTPPAISECSRAIADTDWLAEGANAWDAPHPVVPLRLARLADVRAADAASLAQAWAPRLSGVPLSPDASGWRGREPLLGVLDAWIQPGGQHVFVNGDPCKIFDDVVYHDGLVARFLATQGTDLYALSHPTTHRCLERETCTFE